MNSYQQYKDSNIDWIGEIPRHWEVAKPKYKLNRVTRSPEKEDEVITCFRDGIVTLRKNRREDGFTVSLKEHGYQQIRPGDLVVHEMDGFEGAIGISDSKGKSTPVYTVIEPNKNADLRYIAYLLRVMSKTGKIESLGRSIRERTTDFRWNMWSVINFPFPPVNEQKLISEFLNKKTQKIDTLIKKIEKKIDLLKEKRIALINQYVTKGLDQNVEMKDCGIERIGEIPKHWKLSKIKYVSELNGRIGYRGYTVNDIVQKGEGAITLGPSNIIDDKLKLEKNVYISWEKYHESPEIKLYEGDIVLVKTASIGKVAYINKGGRDLTLNPQLVKIKCRDIYSKYLYFFLRSNFYKDQILSSKEGGTTPTISQNKILNHLIVVPPLNEQKLISEFLSNQIEKIDKLIFLTEKKIDLIDEYHKSLISSTVTGKIRITEDII